MKPLNQLLDNTDIEPIKHSIDRECITLHQNRITINPAINIAPIDMLILFVKRIKLEYQLGSCERRNYSRIYGICGAKQRAYEYMSHYYPQDAYYFLWCSPLSILMHYHYAKKYISNKYGYFMVWNGYWWNTHYFQNVNGKQAARFAAPRIKFLDWVIDVLNAYKNECS